MRKTAESVLPFIGGWDRCRAADVTARRARPPAASILFAVGLRAFAYPAHPPVFALWTWPGPPTSSPEGALGASVGIDLKLRPESVSSEHARRLRLILDTVCDVELGLNIQIKLLFGAQSRKKSPYSSQEKRVSHYSRWQICTEYNMRSQTEI